MSWPAHIVEALRLLHDNHADSDLNVEAFANIWGGLDRENFLLAVRQGDGDIDTLLALFALNALNDPGIVELLASLLESPYPKVRWVSAYCLGRRRDARALPILYRCLQEFLPPDVPTVEYDGTIYEEWFFDEWRPALRELLQEWTGEPA